MTPDPTCSDCNGTGKVADFVEHDGRTILIEESCSCVGNGFYEGVTAVESAVILEGVMP